MSICEACYYAGMQRVNELESFMCLEPHRSFADRLDQACFTIPEGGEQVKGSQTAPQDDGKTPEAAGEWDIEAAVASFRAKNFRTLSATSVADRDYSSACLLRWLCSENRHYIHAYNKAILDCKKSVDGYQARSLPDNVNECDHFSFCSSNLPRLPCEDSQRIPMLSPRTTQI